MTQFKAGKFVNVPIYSPTGLYTKYDCVYVPSGLNSGRTFVLSAENSYTNLNSFSYSGIVEFGGWYHVNAPLATVNDLFEFSYDMNSDVGVKNSISNFGEGYSQTFNGVGFQEESYSCKMQGVTRKQAGSFVAFVEAKNAESGFYFRPESKEANVNKYTALGVSVSQGYYENFDLSFELKKAYKEDGKMISNQSYTPPPVSGKYDLMDFADNVVDFNQVTQGVVYNVDTGNYAIVMTAKIYLWYGEATQSIRSKEDYTNGLYTVLAPLNDSFPYISDRSRINGKYANPIFSIDEEYITRQNYLEEITYVGPGESPWASYHKKIYESVSYNFLTSLPAHRYQNNVKTQVSLADYFGSQTRLNRSDYFVYPVSLKYADRTDVPFDLGADPIVGYVAGQYLPLSVQISGDIYRKNSPTADQSGSTLVKSFSANHRIVVENPRDSFNIVLKLSTVEDFTSITSVSVE